jgi:hypothetical protein
VTEAPRGRPTASFGRSDPKTKAGIAPDKTDHASKVRARIVLAIKDHRATGHKGIDPKATGDKGTGLRATGLRATGHKGIGVSDLRVKIGVESARSAGSVRSRSEPRRCRTRRS